MALTPSSFVPRIRRGPDQDFDWAIQIRPNRWQKTSGFHWHTCEESDVTGPGWVEYLVMSPRTTTSEGISDLLTLMAKTREATRGTSEGSVDEEISRLRGTF